MNFISNYNLDMNSFISPKAIKKENKNKHIPRFLSTSYDKKFNLLINEIKRRNKFADNYSF